MSAETLALSRFSRRGTVPACENRSAAPAVPSLLRPQDALGAAAFVECKRMQRSRCAFLVELDSVEEFSDTPYRHAKSTPLSYRICIASAMVIIHQFYEPFLCKKTTFFVLYPILRFFLQKIIVSAWYITQKRFLGILPGADEKTGPPPPKREAPFSSTLKTDVIPANRTNRSRRGFSATGMMRGRQEANAPGQKKTPSSSRWKSSGFLVGAGGFEPPKH